MIAVINAASVFMACVLVVLAMRGIRDRVAEVSFEQSLDDAPTRLVYVPRCSPAFGGAALVCVDAPTAKTFSTTEAQ